jgi:thiol-disulfide isomerase/thioredoxin
MIRYLRYLLLLSLGVVLYGCGEAAPTQRPQAKEILGLDATGKEIKLSDFRGKVVLVDFWFDGCTYCRQNHMEVNRPLTKKYKDRPFVILGVNVDKDVDTMRRSEKEQEMTWPSLWVGSNMKNMGDFTGSGYPTLLLIDHKGRLAASPIEGLPMGNLRTKLEAKIEQLVLEAEQETTKTAAN